MRTAMPAYSYIVNYMLQTDIALRLQLPRLQLVTAPTIITQGGIDPLQLASQHAMPCIVIVRCLMRSHDVMLQTCIEQRCRYQAIQGTQGGDAALKRSRKVGHCVSEHLSVYIRNCTYVHTYMHLWLQWDEPGLCDPLLD